MSNEETKKQRMNLPNKLTIMRILLVPVIIIIPLIPLFNKTILFTTNAPFTLTNLIVLVLFAIASFTDYLDGNLARKNNQVTDFGKLMDPLADKILVIATLIVLLEMKRMYGIVITIIVAREFLVTGIRLLGVTNNQVIAASKFGKMKTVSQMITIIYLLFCAPMYIAETGTENTDIFGIIGFSFIIIAALLTIISGVDYFIKNKGLIKSI